eukprot:TRINITY_DN19994_c0_g1_i1.p1 TRINITY_DN19994_c0_g1~~TRINITY_DN19994_c0_g1_i1.p1  ORF type:complete len:368 (+),score=81.02 TRINITY_DN19994_c0_g1_i1:148-1104(+)
MGLIGFSEPISLLRMEHGPSEQSLYLDPVVFDHSLEGPVGAGASNWLIAQWLIPNGLNPASVNFSRGSCMLDSVVWNLANQDARVCLGNSSAHSGLALELAQQGDEVPCGNEFDLFVSPVDSNYPAYAQNVLPLSQMPSLASLASVTFGFTASLVYSQITPRCGPAGSCGPSGELDYGYAVAALTLDNVAAGQTLFYQIMLYDSRQDTPACGNGNDPCVQSREWFFTTNPWGVSDAIVNFDGAACLRVDPLPRAYTLDVLPALVSALKQGAQYGLSPDASGWQVSGLYVGLGLQGSVTQTVIVSNISLYAQPNDAQPV